MGGRGEARRVSGTATPSQNPATPDRGWGNREPTLRARGAEPRRCGGHDGSDSDEGWQGERGCGQRPGHGASACRTSGHQALPPRPRSRQHPRRARAVLKLQLELVAGRKYEYLIAVRV